MKKSELTSFMSNSKWKKLLDLINDNIICIDMLLKKSHSPYFFIKLIKMDESKIQFLPAKDAYSNSYFLDGELIMGPTNFVDIQYIKIPSLVLGRFEQNINDLFLIIMAKLKVEAIIDGGNLLIYGYK